MSQLTTHILDTSLGKPAPNVEISLEKEISPQLWKEVSRGKTNEDGRLPGLLPENSSMEFGNYKLTFHTKTYYDNLKTESLYPFISIVFTVSENRHYHIPLLLNPFGFSTYRGS
jgi:5-hydroxyisourate hydrolase